MIILYALTGCISAAFCVVIVLGAVRAIRHPERYGPRANQFYGEGFGGGPYESRARGLTRAILDTFPVIKFGQGQQQQVSDRDIMNGDVYGQPRSKNSGTDITPSAIEMQPTSPVPAAKGSAEYDVPISAIIVDTVPPSKSNRVSGENDFDPYAEFGSLQQTSSAGAASQSSPPRAIARPPKPPETKLDEQVVPSTIGRETCPICIIDFEPGDDVRVLPCAGHHRFHQVCVDPWLLELSSSCPICRQGQLQSTSSNK